MAADPFIALASALRAAGKNMGERMDGLRRAEIALENIKKASTDLSIVNKQGELNHVVGLFCSSSAVVMEKSATPLGGSNWLQVEHAMMSGHC
ncbi:hypothetical protein FJTKL_00921 [Diaporthe vaccinii]|uniref:Uncharacterized protein n=1 Tax=Diaporthe vaccinii TaxID=105482 RepID=A0ABR4E1V2_9PEZI